MDHALDYPLAAFVAVLVVKESFALVRWAVAKRNGRKGQSAPEPATKLDVEHAKAEILREVRTIADAVHGRVTEVSDRVSRVEGRLAGLELP